MPTVMIPNALLSPRQDAVRCTLDAVEMARRQYDHASAAGNRNESDAERTKLELADHVRDLHHLDPTAVPADLRHLVTDPHGRLRPRPLPVPAPPRPTKEQIAEQLGKVLDDWTLHSEAPDRRHREVAQERLRDSVRFLHSMSPDDVPESLRDLVTDREAKIPKRT